ACAAVSSASASATWPRLVNPGCSLFAHASRDLPAAGQSARCNALFHAAMPPESAIGAAGVLRVGVSGAARARSNVTTQPSNVTSHSALATKARLRQKTVVSGAPSNCPDVPLAGTLSPILLG